MKKRSFEDFVSFVKQECKTHGVTLKLTRGKFVKLENIRCSGYFCDEVPPILVCAMNAKKYKQTFAHEYCHMTQWLDKIPLWDKASTSLNKVTDWLNGKEVRNIKHHLAVTRELELDNEKRAAKIARTYDLDCTVADYVRGANAYVIFYNWLLETRVWSRPKKSPYINKRILKAMSTKFDMNYETMDEHIHQIFLEEGI